MIGKVFLALSFTAALTAQPADLVATITESGVEVETKVPLADAEEIRLDINILGGISLESWSAAAGITCVEKSVNWLQCDVAPAAAGSKAAVTMKTKVDFDHRLGHVTADLLWRDRGFRAEHRYWRKDLYRFREEFVVRNTADAGPGTLRQAILDSNAACDLFATPCLIRFDLGAAATIKPITPLPAMTTEQVVIDGNGQVTLDGSAMIYPANGLYVTGFAQVVIRNLTIQRFPENGIEVATIHYARIESCVIKDNGSRGVTSVGGGGASISDSVISGNRRSGVFAGRGGASVIRSVVTSNGASGVFAGPGSGAAIIDSVIAHNAHFGMATFRDNRAIDVNRTRIVGNGLGQIDIDLDGPSYFVRRERHEYQPPNGPLLTSATYDPSTDRTTVQGKLEGVEFFYFLTYDLQFYATTAANEADQYLGAIHITQPDFTFTVRGDLRGRFITANTIRRVDADFTERETSELSTPIEVTSQ